MKSNRLLPYQFGKGNTADFTRVEKSLLALVDNFNDLPPDLMRRRWSPSWATWGYAPDWTVMPELLPFMRCLNNVTARAVLQPPTTFTNPERVKSCDAPGITPNGTDQDLLTWEVAWVASRPIIIAAVAVFAESNGSHYNNNWVYGARHPDGFTEGSGTEDYTLQVCVDDGWDMENRKKLRQESLIYQTPSNDFEFFPSAAVVPDTASPAHPVGVFQGFGVHAETYVLVPAGGRVRVQWTIPKYAAANKSSWSKDTPQAFNVWNLCAQIWEATQ